MLAGAVTALALAAPGMAQLQQPTTWTGSATTTSSSTAVVTGTQTPTPRVGSSLWVARQNALTGQRTSFVALLTSGLGPISGKPIRFQVMHAATSTVVASMTLYTDAGGRVFFPFQVPQVGAPVYYQVRAFFDGDDRYEPAQDSERTYVRTPGPTGALDVDGAPTVRGYATDVRVGRPTVLRAHVGAEGAGRGRVSFWVQGTRVGAGIVDGSGLARLTWTPTATALQALTATNGNERRGPVQAFFEPTSGSPIPAGGIFALHAWDARTTCALFPGSQTCSEDSGAPQAQSTVRRGRIRVYQNNILAGQLLSPPTVSFRFPVPPTPPAARYCSEDTVDIDGFCQRSCEQVDYATLDHLGDVQTLRQVDSCGGTVTVDLSDNQMILRLAHDVCRLVATQQGRTTWGHDIEPALSQTVAAAFRFRDPWTQRTSSGWRAQLQHQLVVREGSISYPVTVECR